MEMNDLKIRQLITGLCDTPGALDGLRRETGLYVYSYPAMAYRKDRDTCSEFYLYVMERLDKVLASFPAGADVRFKTWFNYVLRNQFHNFSYYQKQRHVPCSGLDGREEELVIELFDKEETGLEELEKGLAGIGEWDRILIKFHYMPDALDAAEIRRAAALTGMSLGEILEIQGELIKAQNGETLKKRELASKIGRINLRLTEWKHRLDGERARFTAPAEDAELGGMNVLMEKIARAESARSRMLRSLKTPDRKVFQVFSRLFPTGTAAGRRLDLARKKLRFEMTARKKRGNGAA